MLPPPPPPPLLLMLLPPPPPPPLLMLMLLLLLPLLSCLPVHAFVMWWCARLLAVCCGCWMDGQDSLGGTFDSNQAPAMILDTVAIYSRAFDYTEVTNSTSPCINLNQPSLYALYSGFVVLRVSLRLLVQRVELRMVGTAQHVCDDARDTGSVRVVTLTDGDLRTRPATCCAGTRAARIWSATTTAKWLQLKLCHRAWRRLRELTTIGLTATWSSTWTLAKPHWTR